MKVVTLCSGSQGNCTFIEINNKKIIIDAGKTFKYINNSLIKIGVNIKDIDYVFITHNHKDHVDSLHSMIRNSNAILCTTLDLYNSLKEKPVRENVKFFDDEIILDNIKISALRSSHDAPDSRNYIIEHNNKKISIITDTGYVKQKHFKKFYNSDIFLMESNHDIELLQKSSKPFFLKQRILSDVGHLSNNQAGFYLSKIIGPNTKKILLIHLSEQNNNADVAIETVNNILSEYKVSFENIKCAKQFEISEVLEID